MILFSHDAELSEDSTVGNIFTVGLQLENLIRKLKYLYICTVKVAFVNDTSSIYLMIMVFSYSQGFLFETAIGLVIEDIALPRLEG